MEYFKTNIYPNLVVYDPSFWSVELSGKTLHVWLSAIPNRDGKPQRVDTKD